VCLADTQSYNAAMLVDVEGKSTVLDSKLVAARWYLGELSGEEMPGIACQALELGYDGKNLRRLAGLTSPAIRDITEIVDAALRELGVQAPITKRDAALWMAKRVAGEIIEGRTEPYDGACRIGLLYSIEETDLQHWSVLVGNYEVAAATGEIEKSKRDILEAARSLRNDAGFGAAVVRFQKFLRANSYPERILWVMPEDVLVTGKRFVYVRNPIPAINEVKAGRMYEEGVAEGRGLLMSTVCRVNASTYCYIWFPRSVKEVPQGIWPDDGSLKLAAKDKSSSFAGRPIRGRVLWALLKFWHRKNQELKVLLFSG